MPRFAVEITDAMRTVEVPTDPTKPTPEVRHIYWETDADDVDAAKEAGMRAFQDKYGTAPVQSIIKVSAVDI